MKYKIVGWIFTIAGGFYIGLLGASAIAGAFIGFNIPILVVSLLLFFAGQSLVKKGKRRLKNDNASKVC